MSAFENAVRFFHSCETLEGWETCQRFVAANARFSAQCEPLVEIRTVKEHVDWMTALGTGPLAGCSYELHGSAYDEVHRTAIFFATFTARHLGNGGPVPPTNKQTDSHYVYVLVMDENGQVASMQKVWNAPWAMRELGWLPVQG